MIEKLYKYLLSKNKPTQHTMNNTETTKLAQILYNEFRGQSVRLATIEEFAFPKPIYNGTKEASLAYVQHMVNETGRERTAAIRSEIVTVKPTVKVSYNKQVHLACMELIRDGVVTEHNRGFHDYLYEFKK